MEHSRAEAPNECCGVLAGTGHRVTAVYRAANAEASTVKYSLVPRELFDILKEVDKKGWEVVGFYHSHTHSEAYPSASDRRLAFWPDCRYVIVSLEDNAHPVARAFRIVDGSVTEEPIKVIDKSIP